MQKLFLGLSFLGLLASCDKKDIESDIVTKSTQLKPYISYLDSNDVEHRLEAKLYVDGAVAKYSDFQRAVANGYTVVATTGRAAGLPDWPELYALKDDDAYVAFGRTIGADFQKIVNFENAIHEYAEDNGLYENLEMDSTGRSLPSSYFEYESMMKEQFNLPKVLPVTLVHKHIVGQSWNQFIALSIVPHINNVYLGTAFMNNKISRMESLQIYHGDIVYDNAFYGGKIITFQDWGWKRIQFVDDMSINGWGNPLGFVNDRATSWLIYL